MHTFLKTMGVVLLWLCMLGSVVLLAYAVMHLVSDVPGESAMGRVLLIYALVIGIAGAVQAALLWAAGRGLEILEQTSRFYYRAARIEEANAKATRALLEEINEGIAAIPAVVAGGYDRVPDAAPPAEEQDERFKLMTPEEAERMFDEESGPP